MKAGRKKKPTALSLIDGNPGNRPLNAEEPEPPKVYAPDPPDDFTDLEAAKWIEVSMKLADCRVLTVLDLDALAIYCRNWVAMMEALADIKKRGKLLTMPKGGSMWNPSWSQYKHSESVCRSIMSEFGMTPSSRAGVSASGDGEGKDQWANI